MKKAITFEALAKKLGTYVRTEQIANNHTISRFKNGSLLTSYGSHVAAYVNGQLYLSPKHDYSKTTSKFVKQFTCMPKDDRNRLIETGEILTFNDK